MPPGKYKVLAILQSLGLCKNYRERGSIPYKKKPYAERKRGIVVHTNKGWVRVRAHIEWKERLELIDPDGLLELWNRPA
jgi:hypothetical protein